MVTVSWHEIFCFIPRNCLFQAEKRFVSPCETNRYVSLKLLPLQARHILIATAITECFYLVLGAGERIK